MRGPAQWAGHDAQSVRQFLDLGSELAQLAGQVANPIGFLVADVGDARDRGWSLGEECDGRQRLHGVADRVHVDRDSVQAGVRPP